MTEIGIGDLRRIQLDILSDVDDFCRNNGLSYSLGGGTLLGAVRHKGYIPWDDDIDIMMPRPDYDRFVRTYASQFNYLVDFTNENSFRETFVKVCRKDTLMVDNLLERSEFGVNIDVFPIDGVPTDAPMQYVDEISSDMERIARFCAFYKVAGKKRAVMFIKFLLKRIASLQFKSVQSMKHALDDKLRSCEYETSSLAGAITGVYGRKEVMEKTIFESLIPMAFEDRVFMGLKAYDAYLTAHYGDYMKLPPVEKQVAPHHYKAYFKNQN